MTYYKRKPKKKKDTPLFDAAGIKVQRKGDPKSRLDRVFSEYIRLRDAMPNGTFRCISCGQVKDLSQADCGHYVNRRHMATRFDEMNCNAQRRSCNRFDEGNMQGYRRGLVAKYGEQRVLLLEAKKHESRKYSMFEYEALIQHYKEEVKRLRKEKEL